MRSILQLKNMFIGGCVLLCLTLVGCLLITKTFTIVFYIEDKLESDQDNIGKEYVDLEGNEIWVDHRDEIKSVDAVEFAVKMVNCEETEATGQVFISDDGALTTHSAIQNGATLVLDGIVIPPFETKVIEREESIQYLRNFEELRDQVESGNFYVYAIADTVPFCVEVLDSLAVIISFTAGE